MRHFKLIFLMNPATQQMEWPRDAEPFQEAAELPPSQTTSAAGSPRSQGTAPPLRRPVAQRASSNMDDDVLDYARWISRQARQTTGIDTKLTAISKRTASELRRAEKERGEQALRLSALEEFCFQKFEDRLTESHEEHKKTIEEEVARLRSKIEVEGKRTLEELQGIQDRTQVLEYEALEIGQQLKALTKREDQAHEALRQSKKALDESKIAIDRIEMALTEAVDRSEMHEAVEGLRGMCTSDIVSTKKWAAEKMTANSNEQREKIEDLRGDLLTQRTLIDRQQGDAQRRQEELEVQLADLGSALAVKLHARIASSAKALDERLDEARERIESRLDTAELVLEKIPHWRRESAEMQNGFARLQETLVRDLERSRESVRNEIQSVHLEVMSVNTRVSAIEERLTDPSMETRAVNATRRHQQAALQLDLSSAEVLDALGDAQKDAQKELAQDLKTLSTRS